MITAVDSNKVCISWDSTSPRSRICDAEQCWSCCHIGRSNQLIPNHVRDTEGRPTVMQSTRTRTALIYRVRPKVYSPPTISCWYLINGWSIHLSGPVPYVGSMTRQCQPRQRPRHFQERSVNQSISIRLITVV